MRNPTHPLPSFVLPLPRCEEFHHLNPLVSAGLGSWPSFFEEGRDEANGC